MLNEFQVIQERVVGLSQIGKYRIMGPKRRISLEDRGKVLALSEEGYTQREIAACVGCTQSRVSEILKKKRLAGSVKDANIPGWKQKTSEREDKLMVRKSKSNR